MGFRSQDVHAHALSLRIATLASVAVIGLTLWAYLVAERPASAGSVIDCTAALAAIWGTKYVGDGFFSQRDASERSLAPVLFTCLTWDDHEDSDVRYVEVHNAGASAAVAIRGIVRIRHTTTGRVHFQMFGSSEPSIKPGAFVRYPFLARSFSLEHDYVEVMLEYGSAIRGKERAVWRFPYINQVLSRSPED